jgi:hypothetical protein
MAAAPTDRHVVTVIDPAGAVLAPQQKERATMDVQTILDNVREVSARFAAERRERQHRQELVAALFRPIQPLIGPTVQTFRLGYPRELAA